MAKNSEWLMLNLEEIKARRIDWLYFNKGRALVCVKKSRPEINLIEHNYVSGCNVIKRNVIDYNKLISAPTVEKRIEILLDAVRDWQFMFYIDSRLVKVILME